MLKYINLNTKYPENNNLCITDNAREIVKIHNGKKFVYKKYKNGEMSTREKAHYNLNLTIHDEIVICARKSKKIRFILDLIFLFFLAVLSPIIVLTYVLTYSMILHRPYALILKIMLFLRFKENEFTQQEPVIDLQ